MKFLLSAIIILVSFTTARSSLVSASHSSSILDLSAHVLVDTDTDMVTLTMTGPDGVWFAYGFGGFAMNDTYALVVEGNGTITERKLGDHSPGAVLSESIVVKANVVSDGKRTVQLSRSRIGSNADYFTFPNGQATSSIILARGMGSDFSYHGSSNKAGSSMVFSSLVPLRWTNFEAKQEGRKIQLIWTTENEEHIEFFTIQRSAFGIRWTDVDYIKAKNRSSSAYAYNDVDFSPGINYYRIKEMGFDGSFSYSSILSVEVFGKEENGKIDIFPNPATIQINIRQKESFKDARIQIYNTRYQLIFDGYWKDEGKKSIPLEGFETGNYILTIKHRDWIQSTLFTKV